VVKGTAKLPPMHRVVLGVVSTGLAALSIGLAGTAVRGVRKNMENGSEDSVIVKIPKKVIEEMVTGEDDSGIKKEFVTKTAKKLVEFNNSNSTTKGGLSTDGGSSWGTGSGTGSEASTSTVGKTTEYLNNMKDKVDWGGGDGSNFIPSLLDENLSPLEVLINCEILINILILIHIILLVLILIQKFNIKIVKNSSVGFISKFCNKYKLNKIQKFISIIGELTDTYLTVLIIINVITIVFYIFLNVYINIELSSNLNDFINVYHKYHLKKSGILLLLLNCKIKYKNSVLLVWDKNKYVNKIEQKLYSNSNLLSNNSIRNSINTTVINTTVNTEIPGTREATQSMIGGDLWKLPESIINQAAAYLEKFFEPVQLSFSNEVMSQQIQNVSILLWILTVCLSIFFISLLFNIALFIFSENLTKYFTNKYILLYINFNRKIIGFEIFMLSGWIIYILYLLLNGLHYIAIHPVIFPV